jgi:hypothetical protein
LILTLSLPEAQGNHSIKSSVKLGSTILKDSSSVFYDQSNIL